MLTNVFEVATEATDSAFFAPNPFYYRMRPPDMPDKGVSRAISVLRVEHLVDGRKSPAMRSMTDNPQLRERKKCLLQAREVFGFC